MCLKNCKQDTEFNIEYDPLQTDYFNLEIDDNCDYIDVDKTSGISDHASDLSVL